MKKIMFLTFVAALAMAFVGCDSIKETNSNKAVVVNNNAGANAANMANSNAMTTGGTTMNSNTTMTMNSNTMTMNGNLTREEYDRDKDKYAADAKSAGRKIGTGAEDGWLWTKTRTALATTAGLRESTINVDVDNGVVTLTGSVGSKEQLMQAVKVAQEIKDVKSVKNNLTVNANDSLTNQMTSGNANMKTNANMKK